MLGLTFDIPSEVNLLRFNCPSSKDSYKEFPVLLRDIFKTLLLKARTVLLNKSTRRKGQGKHPTLNSLYYINLLKSQEKYLPLCAFFLPFLSTLKPIYKAHL